MPVRAHDVRWFSELVLRLHACTHERALLDALLPGVHRHFRSTISAVEEVAYNLSAMRLHGVLTDVRPPDAYAAALHDSPMVLRWCDRRPHETMHLSQMETRRRFHRTMFYDAVCRPLNFEDQLIGTFGTADGVALNFSVNRDTLFTGEERALMEQLRRHVQACLRRVRACPGRFARLPHPELRLDHHLRLILPQAATWDLLAAYLPVATGTRRQGRLPDLLHRWVQAALAQLNRRPPPHPLTFLQLESRRGILTVRLFPYQDHGHTLHCTEELAAASGWELTAREREVLHWLRAGKRDGEIAIILGCAARTVEKHVAAILRKSGSPNRLLAARQAGSG